MKPIRSAVAWALFAVALTGEAVAIALPDPNFPRRGLVLVALPVVLTAACGALVASRRPDNPVGWLLEGIAASLGVEAAATQYAQHTLVAAPGSLPGGAVAAWLQAWVSSVAVPLVVLVLLVFPTGKLLSRRWRIAGWVAVVSTSVMTIDVAFRSGAFDTFHGVPNPLGSRVVSAVVSPLTGVFSWVVLAVIVLSAVSVVLRFRRSRGVERNQMKWVTYATVAALVLAGSAVGMQTMNVGFVIPIVRLDYGFAVIVIGVSLIPLGMAVAILRHRAFDIDRVISRTVSYAIVTTLLAGTFAVLVLVPTAAIGSRARPPGWLVAVATLAVAGLFGPMRRRVQSAVDRRFNRARYDAVNTIAAFSAHLRDELDVDALRRELAEVAVRTMQPAHVAIWLAPR